MFKRKEQAFCHTRSFWMFVLPALALFGAFFLLPLVLSIWFSFTNYDGWKTMDFIGLKNYTDILQSKEFYETIGRTLVYAVCNLPFKIAVPLLLAALVTSKRLRGTTLVRTLVYIPGLLSALVAGITIIGPIAASISTVSSLLLTATSSIIKDIYMYEKEKRQQKISEKSTSTLSQMCTLVLGLIIFFISINPPDVIWKINMFAFGGLETAFVWVFILGMFWKKANRTGAVWSMIGGTVVYCVTMALGIKIMDIHQILLGMIVSLLCMVIGSYVGKDVDKKVLGVYFCE